MISVVLAVHILVCVALCVIILLQHGKGADIGAVFGGSSQTVFGASGAGNALTKATVALAAMFFATSMILAYTSTQRATGSIFGGSLGSGPRSVMKRKPVPIPGAPVEKSLPQGNPGSQK